MAASSTCLEVDKEGNLKLQVQATTLPAGVTLLSDPAPTVQAQRRTKRDPETWAAAEGVTIDEITVTDRINIKRLPTVIVLASAQALQFRWKQDPDPQPSATDTPIPGNEYRVSVKARRSDGYDWVRKFPVKVNP